MSKSVVEIAATHLGQTVGKYSDQYDPSLLVKVPRKENRDAYSIDDDNPPFVGYDVWNAYEVSAITEKGLPVSGLLKISYSSDSKYHVESKSIKLYLNSFNMTPIGKSRIECIKIIQSRVSGDLSTLLETHVTCKMHVQSELDPFANDQWIGFDYTSLEDMVALDDINFTSYKSDASQLEVMEVKTSDPQTMCTDLLRSNCRVTNQPDWGDIYVYIKGDKWLVPESFAKYVVSHRKVSHFHEEICEMVYKHLMDALNPEELMVTCLYTRRGGIDINPTRASHEHLLDQEFIDVDYVNEKTLRQ